MGAVAVVLILHRLACGDHHRSKLALERHEPATELIFLRAGSSLLVLGCDLGDLGLEVQNVCAHVVGLNTGSRGRRVRRGLLGTHCQADICGVVNSVRHGSGGIGSAVRHGPGGIGGGVSHGPGSISGGVSHRACRVGNSTRCRGRRVANRPKRITSGIGQASYDTHGPVCEEARSISRGVGGSAGDGTGVVRHIVSGVSDCAGDGACTVLSSSENIIDG